MTCSYNYARIHTKKQRLSFICFAFYMERYVKIKVENYRSQEAILWKQPFHIRLLLEISMRARWGLEKSIDGLDQGEFFLSENEYSKFNLKLSEKGQITRAIKKFIQADFIEKIELKRGSKWGHVYKLLDWCPFQASFQNSEQIDEQTGNRQRTSRDERSKKYNNKKIIKMDFEEQVQAYDTWRHDEFLTILWEEKTNLIKKAWFKQYE